MVVAVERRLCDSDSQREMCIATAGVGVLRWFVAADGIWGAEDVSLTRRRRAGSRHSGAGGSRSVQYVQHLALD